MRARFKAMRGPSILFGVALIAALVLPTVAAQAGPQDGRIVIENNSQFDEAHGVRSGSGTMSNPYVIEGWDVHLLEIHDTSKPVVIKNNIIGTLRLNWTGGGFTVVDNRISDLRVNENVKRTGDPTTGQIAHNEFSVVGQLRHFDGVFVHNTVGTLEEEEYICCQQISQGGHRAVNFDGFNGAVFKDNTIYGGYVEARLHGHHHSSGFGEHSHYHGTKQSSGDLDHMKRHHSVTITNNTIYSDGPYGLIYTDSNHAANDRTAASEQNEALNDPHEHFTKVAITNNKLIGSGIVVDIFNADDSKHLRTNTGHVAIRGNKVVVKEYRDTANLFNEAPHGISVWQAKDLHLFIEHNQVLGEAKDEATTAGPPSDTVWGQVPAGIRLEWVEKAWIHLTDNIVTNRDVGIYARSFEDVQWWIDGFETQGVAKRVDYDNSSSQPKEQP